MSWPMVKLRKLVVANYGKALKKEVRDENGDIEVFGSAGLVGFHNESLFEQQTIVIGRKGSVGKVIWAPKGGWVIDTAYYLTVKENIVLDWRYLFYVLQNVRLDSKTITTSIPGLNRDDFYDTEIPLPPLEEQKRIAAILDQADAIRQKRKQAIALADEFLRSVFLDMFGNDLVRPSERITLGEVTILDAKMVDPREEKYLDLLHIGPDRIEKRSGKLLPALTAREEMLISKKFLFDEEYVLYSKIRPYLRKVAIPDFSALCSADMYPVKPVKDKVTREFIWMLLLSDLFDNYVGSLPDRANIPKLNKKELAAFEFSLPHFEKIKKFSNVVKKINYKKVKMEESFSLATCSFNALSQKAFSGQL